MPDAWKPSGYMGHAGFVPALGATILEWLAPKEGERVLDLGCGEGSLTAKLAERGVEVVGVDSSASMVDAARRNGVDARVMGGESLSFSREFDAVFSNAALHWMSDPRAVTAGVRRALKPGGRYLAEAGGHGNVAAIVTALRAVLAHAGYDVPDAPWYFPAADEHAELLTDAGFDVLRCELFPRPTPLPTDVAGWMDTFAFRFFEAVPEDARTPLRDEAVALLMPALRDGRGRWHADYVRLRFEAILRTQG